MPDVDAPMCPICTLPALATATGFGIRHSCCGLWSWGGKPLADKRTHEARKAAHAAFDPVWKSKRVSRGKAYKELAAHLGIKPVECHMGSMSADLAERIPQAVKEIWS